MVVDYTDADFAEVEVEWVPIVDFVASNWCVYSKPELFAADSRVAELAGLLSSIEHYYDAFDALQTRPTSRIDRYTSDNDK